MESEDCANEWRAPVIRDVIDAAVMNSRWNVLPSYDHRTGTDRVITPELEDDLRRIFMLLYDHGMNLDYIRPGEKVTSKELFQKEPVARFLQFDK